MQQLRRLVKARRPPTLLVSTVLQRVWSPPIGEELTVLPLPLSCPHSLLGVTLTEQHGFRTALAQNGLKDAQQRLGQLLLQVVLSVDGQAVLQHKQGVLWAGCGYQWARVELGQYPRGVMTLAREVTKNQLPRVRRKGHERGAGVRSHRLRIRSLFTGWLEKIKANRGAGTQSGEGRRWHSSQLCTRRHYGQAQGLDRPKESRSEILGGAQPRWV